VEEVDEVIVLKPEQCQGCHAPLSGDDASPFRHQVIEMPPIKPVITEYQWHQLVCTACGATTRAPWPAGVPSGTYGPRVHATVALCTGSYRLSKRTTAQVMDELFGVPMSVGTISQSEQTTTEVVTAPVEEARAYVHEQRVAHLDETSWRQGAKRAWLWVAVTSFVTVFLVRMCCGTLKPSAAVVGSQRNWATPCLVRRTRCSCGGIGYARARCNARRFGRI
jgi:transposase